MASKLNQLIRAQAGKSPRVYNDRLKDGPNGQQRRSLKVQGWGKGDYTDAKRLLEAAGYKVKLVEFDIPSYLQYYRSGRVPGKQVRLHVTE